MVPRLGSPLYRAATPLLITRPRIMPGYHSPMDKRGVQDQLRQFVAERDWGQFHTPENLAKSIAIESAELLESFQWGPEADESQVRLELADVLTYCFLLADRLGEDPASLILEKLEITRRKYPSDVAYGKATKYDQL